LQTRAADVIVQRVPSIPLPATLAALVGLGIGYFSPALLSHTAEPGVVTAPQAELQLSEALSRFDRLDRISAQASVLARATPESLAGVLAAVDAAPLNPGDIEYLLTVSWWAEFDPEAARRWSERDLRVGGHRLILEELFRVWARRDPEAAMAAVPELRYRIHRTAAAVAVLSQVDVSQVVRIVTLLRMLSDADERRAAIEAITTHELVAGNGIDAAKKRIGILQVVATEEGDFDLAADLQAASVQALASIDPVAAGLWWSEWAESQDEIPASSARDIGLGWTKLDPISALGWIAGLPPGAVRDETVKISYRQWLVQDFASARAWGAEHSQSPERWVEPAMINYAVVVGAEDPLKGIAVTGNLSEAAIRNEALLLIVRRWLRNDRETADAWLESSDLEPSQIARIRATADRAPKQRARQPRGAGS
jgi:hypothetical protein